MERISEIKYGCPGRPVEIRVLRRWVPSLKDSELWFLVVDKHGDAIQVLAQKNDKTFVEANFIVSLCYKIEHYTCSETNQYQKMLENPLHLNIGPASSLIQIEDNGTLPKTWFRFFTANDLQNVDHRIQGYPDVIGVFTRKKDCNKKNVQREPYLLLTLKDPSAEELLITLWKECIDIPEKFDRSSLLASTSDTIIVVTNVRTHVYEGKLWLNSTAATHVYFDPTIPEKDVLMHRLQCKDDPFSLTHASYPSIALQDLTNRNHVAVMGKTFLCTAKTKEYKENNSWYTVYCPTCGSEIVEQGDHWFCTTDGKTDAPRFSYNISALFDDGTTFVQAAVTDNTVAKIIGMQCCDLVQKEKYHDRKKLPPQFDSSKNTDLNIHIQLGKWSTPQRRTYIVVGISQNSSTEYHPSPDPTTLTSPPPPTPTTDAEDRPVSPITSTTPTIQSSGKKRLNFLSPSEEMAHLDSMKKQKKAD